MDKPFAITLDVASSLPNHTGSWRTERPEYVHRLPPCAGACPAGEEVQQWLYAADGGDYEAAWREIMTRNPFPAVIGRVCYHPCESACNRGQLDDAVGINSVERFLGDEGLHQGWTVTPAPDTGRRVLIVGGGPSGLSAAYHLRLRGHAVTIVDAGEQLGGMMRYGIPRYRLPREVLDAEIERIVALGVTVERRSVSDLEAERDGYDAVFLAVGAHLAKRAYIPAGSSAKMLDAVALLRSMEGAEPPQLGRRVAVYGGGNTAFDAARTAKRLGAQDAVVVYRRTRERMPAHDTELEQALAEGISVKWLSTIQHADAGRIVVERMELDENGFPQPTGELDELEADTLVLALGQDSDLSLLEHVPGLEVADGVVQVDQRLMTGCPGVFAGGDMVPSERTVTVGIGHGRAAAESIDAYLGGTGPLDVPAREPADFGVLNTWYFSDAPHAVQPELDRVRRTSTFDEVVGDLDAGTALYEARRCLSCGTCFACDNCYGVCPDNAVVKLDGGEPYAYAIDLDHCKGCGLCAAECPAGAIVMVPEER